MSNRKSSDTTNSKTVETPSDPQTVPGKEIIKPEAGKKGSQAFKKLVQLTKDKGELSVVGNDNKNDPIWSFIPVLKQFKGLSAVERVLYPRYKLPPGARPPVAGGQPITEQQAVELRVCAFGTAACAPRSEWTRTPLAMRAPLQPLAYGLVAPRNGARSLLAALQAHIVKHLLFDSRPQAKGKDTVPPDVYLRPSEERQEEALWHACSEVLWRCGGGGGGAGGCGGGASSTPAAEPRAVVALPSDQIYVPHSSHYYQDGITEKLHLFSFTNLEDLQIFLKRYIYLFQEEPGPGSMLLLFAAILSRGVDNIKKDMDGKLKYLVSQHVEGSICIATLLLTGRATPHLHNGVLYVGDEEHYAMPQFGILARSAVGLLVWCGGDDKNTKDQEPKPQPGSRLKTPALPIWVTCCAGHYGILFNTNRELLRNYHAERRFDIHYYTCGGCHVLLSVDTRSHDADAAPAPRADDINATPLEKLIHSKWQDAKVTWTGPTPYIGEQSSH